jgi:Domain of unknown function (DUF222)
MSLDLFSSPPGDGEEPDNSSLPAGGEGGPEDDWDAPAGQGLYVCLPAEEITLEGFAQDGRADTMAPGPLLATIVDAVTGEDAKGLAGCADDQLMGIISAARRMEARASWTLTAAVAEYAGRHDGSRPLDAFAADELAFALNLTSVSASEQMQYSTAVATRLPRTFAALHAGRIHPVHLQIIEDETSILSDADAATADRLLAGAVPGMTFGEVRSAAHRLVLKLDPEAVRKRKEAAKSQTHVRPFRERSGNAGLIGRELPSDEVLASWQNVEQRALDLRAAGMPGTLRELRVRAYLDLLQERDSRDLLGGDAGASLSTRDQPAAGREPVAPDQHPADGEPCGPDQDSADSELFDGDLSWPDQPPPDDEPPDGDWSSQNQLPPDDEPPDPSDPAGPDGPGGPDGRGGRGGSGGSGGSGPGPGLDRGLSPAARPSVAALVTITIPWDTYQGRAETPGQADGFGVLDGDDARDLAAAAARHPRTRWCVTALNPDGTAAAHACLPGCRPPSAPPGTAPPDFAPVLRNPLIPVARGPCDHAHAEIGYHPSRKLQHLVRARSSTCTAPGCTRPAARCDLDHTDAWDQGGATCECNLAPLCRHHHRLKQAEGWQLVQPEPGVLVWRTPSGRSYTTAPTGYPA